jgi:hypothetical protein
MIYICLAIGFPLASGNATETQDADFGWWLTEISVGLWLCMPTVGRAEVSGLSWQLVTAIWDEDDGLTLCEQLSWGYEST